VDDLIAKTEQRTHIVDAYTGHLHRRWNRVSATQPNCSERLWSSVTREASWPFNVTFGATAEAGGTLRRPDRSLRPSGRSPVGLCGTPKDSTPKWLPR
jgi:hypothetical protein